MDHISNYLDFSLAGIDPPHNKGTTLPTFSDLPLDTSPNTSDEKNNPAHSTEVTSVQPIDTISEVKKRLYTLKDELSSLIRLLEGNTEKTEIPKPFRSSVVETVHTLSPNGEQIIEGVFNGEKMVGPDGHEYAVPPNYASKSRLVEGDHMKLTITLYGKFIYKQIGPIERKRIIGVLQFDETTQLWSVVHEGNTYKILTASATFYRGKPGDHVVILVPKDAKSSWGAVENIIAS